MSERVLRFPMRNTAAIFLRETADGWLVMVRHHGWIHGCRADALEDARWLSENFGLPIRGLAS
jgi:hypothetical protein